MKYIHILLILILPFSCSAESSINNSNTVSKLLNHFLPELKENSKPSFKLGDFNGDGVKDIVVLFTPKSKPTKSAQLKVLTPWVYPTTKPTNKYRKSLVIFQKTNGEWVSDKTQAYVLLDTNGVLETPSFELLTINKKDKNYASHASMLPIKISNDLIILPTEAGIDTYIYWDKNTYKLFEPEEMP